MRIVAALLACLVQAAAAPPSEIDVLIDQARSLPGEFAADGLIRIAGSEKLSTERKIELLGQAYERAAEAQQPFKRHAGVNPPGYAAGFINRAYDQELDGLSLRLPPLRERREEIPVFLRQFIAQTAERFARPAPAISQRLVQACLAYPWPGNLRELQNFVKRYIVLRDEELAISELTGGMEMGGAGLNGGSDPSKKLKAIVRNVKNGAEAIAIAEALEQTSWKRKKAAALLGISYKALLYKMRQFELRPPETAE